MPVALLNLCFFLLVLNVESAVSVCDVRVYTIDFGCHLEWDCRNASPGTTYTVLSKSQGDGESWRNVSGCVQITQQSCDLSHVFPDLDLLNFIKLTSEFLWINESWSCNVVDDVHAKFSPPSINISMADGSLWVTVIFPCAPSKSCEDEEKDCCPLAEIKSLRATVTLYNEQNPSERKVSTAEVMSNHSIEVEFGFLTPGQVYCAVANFTSKGVLASSPTSLPKCVNIPAKKNESLIIIIVFGVLITLGLVFILLWRQCASSERPLPRSLALLRDLELQNETLIDSSNVAPHNDDSEGDHVSVVSLSDFTFVENQSYYYNTQSLGNGYYTGPILHNPDCIEESVESEELRTEVQHDEFHVSPSHPVLEAEVGCLFQNHCVATPHIPLSSVRVEQTEQDETSTEDPEWAEDVVWGKLNMRPLEDIQAN